MLTAIDELGRYLALHLPPSVLRKQNTAGFSDAFEPGRDVDAVAENIVTFDDDVAATYKGRVLRMMA